MSTYQAPAVDCIVYRDLTFCLILQAFEFAECSENCRVCVAVPTADNLIPT